MFVDFLASTTYDSPPKDIGRFPEKNADSQVEELRFQPNTALQKWRSGEQRGCWEGGLGAGDELGIIKSGQIIATSHDLGPQKVAFWKGNGTPAISGKSSLVKYYNLARLNCPFLKGDPTMQICDKFEGVPW